MLLACSSTSSITPRFSCPLRLLLVLQARNPGRLIRLEMTLGLFYSDSFIMMYRGKLEGTHLSTDNARECASEE